MKHKQGAAINRRQFMAHLAPLGALITVATGNAQTKDSATANRGPRVDYFPDVILTTHEGRQVRFYDDLVEGKVFAINLVHTSCKGSCSEAIANLVALQDLIGDKLGRDIHMYTLSRDPENDTPAVLNEYAAKIGARAGWMFLSGAKEDLKAVQKKTGDFRSGVGRLRLRQIGFRHDDAIRKRAS